MLGVSHLNVKIGTVKTIVDLDVLGANPRDPPVYFLLLCVFHTTAGSSALDSAKDESLGICILPRLQPSNLSNHLDALFAHTSARVPHFTHTDDSVCLRGKMKDMNKISTDA